MTLLTEIFGDHGSLTMAQECARAVLIFAFGLLLVRIAGRRVFGKWSALDIIVSIIIGSNLSRTLTGNAPLWGTLVASTLLMGLHWLLALAAARWSAVSHVLEGRSIELGADGSVADDVRVRHAVSEADLNQALRSKGLRTPEETKLIVLEPSGSINVLK
ncbi:MAG TPA: hypothetical protein VH331_10645 [Allosphingosinicella sp.]|jgi:uncharacterized membrane protein YcaP (DUF421 family)|nr:hypothetical protein [Allosphingosinicella sp.]